MSKASKSTWRIGPFLISTAVGGGGWLQARLPGKVTRGDKTLPNWRAFWVAPAVWRRLSWMVPVAEKVPRDRVGRWKLKRTPA